MRSDREITGCEGRDQLVLRGLPDISEVHLLEKPGDATVRELC